MRHKQNCFQYLHLWNVTANLHTGKTRKPNSTQTSFLTWAICVAVLFVQLYFLISQNQKHGAMYDNSYEIGAASLCQPPASPVCVQLFLLHSAIATIENIIKVAKNCRKNPTTAAQTCQLVVITKISRDSKLKIEFRDEKATIKQEGDLTSQCDSSLPNLLTATKPKSLMWCDAVTRRDNIRQKRVNFMKSIFDYGTKRNCGACVNSSNRLRSRGAFKQCGIEIYRNILSSPRCWIAIMY